MFPLVRFGNLLEYPLRSGVTVSKSHRGTGIPMVNMGELFRYPLLGSVEMARVDIDYTDAARYLLRPGDLLFARRSLTLAGAGKCCLLVDVPVPTTWEGSLIRARIDRKVSDPRFFYYFFMSPQGRIRMEAIVEQVAAAGIRISDLVDLRVPCPDLSEQRAIAEVLGALDDKIAGNERIRDAALGLGRELYAAVSDKETVQLGDVAEVFDGPHATPEKTAAGPWFLSISSLMSGYLDLSQSAHLSDADFSTWTRRVQPTTGDVLFSYETRLGDAALMLPSVRGSLGRRMALLRPKGREVNGALLLHAFLGPDFHAVIAQRAVHGATVDRIPLKELPRWPIALPEVSARPQLAARLESLHESIGNVHHENQALAELRDTLLPKLITGQIRVKNVARVVEGVV